MNVASQRAAARTAPARVVAITGARPASAARPRCAWPRRRVPHSCRRAELAELERLAAEIEAVGGHALPLVADVTSEEDMNNLVGRAVEQFGRLDVMMCNAGFGIAGAVDEMSSTQMRRLMDVNYLGTFHAARAALPVFRRQGQGHLIIVSSIVGKRGVPYMGAYSATKFAQVGLAECLRAELAGIGHSRQRRLPGLDRH